MSTEIIAFKEPRALAKGLAAKPPTVFLPDRKAAGKILRQVS